MTQTGALPHAQYVRFVGVREYEERLDRLLTTALGVVRIFDEQLSRRYNDSQRCALLREFLRGGPGRQVRIVVHDARRVPADHPRLVQIAIEHPRAFSLRETLPIARHVYDPFVLVDGSHYLHRFHYSGMRCAQGTDEVSGATELGERFEALWEAAGAVRLGRPAGL
jgi:hypothetical protein